ncbi:hypothetical protein J5I95_20835 [Candidatus Poribacteria bacterium]|nr:hypothetical protein [Candidatus Poribacteria bacterium]
MIIRSKFHIFVLFTTVLYISTSFLSIAASITKEIENEATPETDYAELRKTAKADAKSDLDNTQRVMWCLAGVGCSVFTVGTAALMDPNPPTRRLLGKSPEYVAIYTDTYTKEMRTSRLSLAGAGCLVSVALYWLIMSSDDSSGCIGSGSNDFAPLFSGSSGCNSGSSGCN